MTYTDGSYCPWKGRAHLKLMDVPTSFLRWAISKRPEMVDKFPGLREYIATRTGGPACVASSTRVADPDRRGGNGPAETRRRKVMPTTTAPAAPVRQAAPGDLFSLAASMREAAQ